MREAEHLFAQVEQADGGPLRISGGRRVIVDTIDGCALEVAGDIRDAVESVGQNDQARALMAELGEWLTMRDFHRGPEGVA